MTGPREGVEPTTRDESGRSDDVLTAEIDAMLESLPPEQRVVVQGIFAAKRHEGPLPDAETFAAYEAACPGAATEILQGAAENRHHRFDMDRRLADTARLSLFLTWSLVAALLIVALVLGLAGHDILSAVFGVGGIVPVLVAMIRGGGTWRGQ